ncbi:tRNA threonylcarbamoyladenosine dehydratase [Thiohalomonas denitrificans]|nr:tRNA threonylcarbamoyladenosine dehydratase [Thiohalomonas denitrificans]
MDPLFQRTAIILGEAGILRLRRAHILVAGLGGVGSYAVEALARAGIGRLTLIDHDIVAGSNLNRQLPALCSTVGRLKTDVMAERVADINPHCDVQLIKRFIRSDDVDELLVGSYDFVIDAIDSLNCKVSLLMAAHERRIPVISSMGAGGKLDPSRIVVGDVMDTDNCPLARVIRKRLRRRGAGRGIGAVWSNEPSCAPLPPEPTESGRDRAVNGTISYLPALFGLTLAGTVIQRLVKS